MNYLDLINLTLEELCYKTVSGFSELIKPDHKRIKTLINRINNIVLDSADWQFLFRECELTLNAGADRVELPDKIRIRSVRSEEGEFFYTENYERILARKARFDEASILGNKLLVMPSSYKRVLEVSYLTKNHARNADGVEVSQMSAPTDETLLPEEHAHLLVFGTCMEFKANHEHPKYRFWKEKYNEALAGLRSSAVYVLAPAPSLRIAGYDF